MATCDPQALMESAKCFALIPSGQLQVLSISLLRQISLAVNPMADTSPQALMASASCFACLSAGQLAIIQTQLLCNIADTIGGGGGGASCVLGGAVNPVAAPPAGCTNAMYINSVTSSLWYWNSGTSTWLPLIV
jgi:hypothetical protein